MASLLKRPALGQLAGLGSLYDARSDAFVRLSLFDESLPPNTVETTENRTSNIKFIFDDTLKGKFDAYGVSDELGVSILAGLAKTEGSGLYISDKRDTNHATQCSLLYDVTTVEEKLNLTSSDVKKCVELRELDTDVATHVVTGISWGQRYVFTAKQTLRPPEKSGNASEKLAATLTLIEEQLIGHGTHICLEDSAELTIFGDNLGTAPIVTDLAGAQKLIGEMPGDGKGRPLIYHLMPLSFLAECRILDIKTDITYRQLGADCAKECVQLFDDIQVVIQQLNDYIIRLQNHPSGFPPGHAESTAQLLVKYKSLGDLPQIEFASLVKDARGCMASDQDLLSRHTELWGDNLPQSILPAMTYKECMAFQDLLTDEGASIVGYKGPSLSALLHGNQHDAAYVLYYNEHVRHYSDSWKDNLAVFLDIVRGQSQHKLAIAVDQDAVDHDTHGTSLEKAYISHLREGRVISEDLVEKRKLLAANCVMRVAEDALDRSVNSKPLDRRAVKIPCPNSGCDRSLQCSWICESCHSTIEYGVVDSLLYCDCGASSYDKWEIQCNDPNHGSDWNQYERGELLHKLKALEPFKDLNILILGETGGEKSTWINAFVNYLTYDSIDDALDAEDLKCVIPCSFQTQTVIGGKFVETEIRVGSSQSEKDGSGGQSATQSTEVYTVDIGQTRVRLIDTPGIGDVYKARNISISGGFYQLKITLLSN
ncbi:P-loop containing protein [Fusarium circinatum]|uniref:P-loop containing protein n=1 Tax=Fusarium circinatum TaxID=48490 RepID=A0A8H5X6K3_FUSCI|nr:P-loop containing protein [Fusarium circinatum]